MQAHRQKTDRPFLSLILASFLFGHTLAFAEPLELVRVTPSGEDVASERQIVFEFNRPVVPLGRMERRREEIPISIEPGVRCEWRWLNLKTLACQLGEQTELKPATSYQITVRPGIKAEDGITLESEEEHEFQTQLAKIGYYYFEEWRSPSWPQIRVVFNQPVDKGTLADHLYFYADGKGRVPISATPHPGYHEKDVAWIIAPTQEFPLDTSVKLQVEPGIRSLVGPEPSDDERAVVAFHTFPEFRFLGVTCRDNGNKRVKLRVDLSAAGEIPRCNPLEEVMLVFSAPVVKEALKDFLTVVPDLAGGRTDFDPWESAYSYSSTRSPHERDEEYEIYLPYGLKAYAQYHLSAKDPSLILDVFGRPLTNTIDIRFETDHRNPRYVIDKGFSTLEKEAKSHLPVAVTNLDALVLNYDTLTVGGVTRDKRDVLTVDPAPDISYYYPVKIRELLQGRSGVVNGYLESIPATKPKPDRIFSQVTPFHVHVKLGHFNSLAWVTDFVTGRGVPRARVIVYQDDLDKFSDYPAIKAEALTDERGIATFAGTEELDPLGTIRDDWYYWGYGGKVDRERLFVHVGKDDDMALVPLVEPVYRYPIGPAGTWIEADKQPRYGHLVAWGTTPQGVYRLGELIQYKLYVRHQDARTFTKAPAGTYQLQLFDPTGKVVHTVADMELNSYGSYSGEIRLPETGAVGWYRLELRANFAEKLSWNSLRVLVSDFTPAPFQVRTGLNGERFKQGERVRVETQASLHAGGPYGGASARITARVGEQEIAGLTPPASGFHFKVSDGEHDTETVHQSEQYLNDQGALTTDFPLENVRTVYGILRVESAVRDDRGKYIASESIVPYAGRDRYVGLRSARWYFKAGESASVETLVIDEAGKIVTSTPVTVAIEREELKASRVKGAGNAYLTEYHREWVKVTECKITSGKQAKQCSFTPQSSGSYQAIASIVDTQGRAHETKLWFCVTGKGVTLWDEGEGDVNHVDVTPEKNEYKVGDTAQFLIKNPLPGAQALITVERFGMQKVWTETFTESTHVLRVPITADHLPGFYLSVVLMSPRVETDESSDQVDLGKPAFRLGYSVVTVKDVARELKIKVQSEAPLYKPGGNVTIHINAETQEGDKPPIELAVLALDEAVLDLIPSGKGYFDPYRGFYKLEPLDVTNFNILQQLVGRRKFEKKGANSGGDGGELEEWKERGNFKYVGYWNPEIKLDSSGKTKVSFALPDNLTKWRIFALGVTETDRFGLGDGSFIVNRDTEIRSALPNQVTEGDTFVAKFTVMNRRDIKRKLSLNIRARGPIESGPEVQSEVEAEPYERYHFTLPIKATGPGTIEFLVKAGDALDTDGLKATLAVHRRQALETSAVYGSTADSEAKTNLTFPEDMRGDVGDVGIVLSPSVIGALEGAFRYMSEYPYICWEQMLTKGVMAAHYLKLKPYLPDSFVWEEAKELPDRILATARNHQCPNGAMTYYSYTTPCGDQYLSAYTAIAFHWLRAHGYQIPNDVEQRLHEYLLELLRKDELPSFYSPGMASSVRAVALAALMRRENSGLTASDVERYRRHIPEMSLFGKAYFLSAANQQRERDSQLVREVYDLIFSHANETSGKLIFSETLDSGFERILATPIRDNCIVLSTLLEVAARNATEGDLSDLPPKLVRTITQARSNRDYWENTQENMFCMNALVEYSRIYESVKPEMKLVARVGEEVIGQGEFKDFRDTALSFARPIRATDPGTSSTLNILREGVGRFYYSGRLHYSPRELRTTPTNSGIEVVREYSVERGGVWKLLENPMMIQSGELVRVDLYVSLPTARNFVVVHDPVPGGLEPVNRELKTASTVDADKAEFRAADNSFWHSHSGWYLYGFSRWSFYHQELRHDSARFYSEYLPEGKYHLSYVAQAVASGEFQVLPARAEEMYDPDVFGLGVPGTLIVEPSSAK